METRLTFNPNENYEQAGLLVYSDDAELRQGRPTCSRATARSSSCNEVNGTAGGFDNTVNISTRPTTVDLRIVSDGTTLRAYYRFDGDASWTQFGAADTAVGGRREPEDRPLRQRQQRHRDLA